MGAGEEVLAGLVGWLVGWVGGGGGECLARRLANRLDRAAAGLARHELAEFVKVDCEGAGVSEEGPPW